MEYDEIYGADGLRIRVPKTDDYRTCSKCGGDCEPYPSVGADDIGAHIAFVCPEHGVGSVIDPFEDRR